MFRARYSKKDASDLERNICKSPVKLTTGVYSAFPPFSKSGPWYEEDSTTKSSSLSIKCIYEKLVSAAEKKFINSSHFLPFRSQKCFFFFKLNTINILRYKIIRK